MKRILQNVVLNQNLVKNFNLNRRKEQKMQDKYVK
ncbi:hypothetical protein CHFL109739_15325 [Chryseobacterium flavum]